MFKGRSRFIGVMVFVIVAALIAAIFAGAIIAKTNSKPKKARVLVKKYAFKPATIRKKGPVKVTWTNKDSASHTITADNGTFDSGDLAKNQTFTTTLSKGTYKYHCKYHPNMKGKIVVR